MKIKLSFGEMKSRSILLGALLLLSATPAFSQGCAMCYSSAQASSKSGEKAVGRGVAILMVPSLGFMTLGVWMACRYARKRDLENVASGEIQELEELWRR